MVPATLTDLHPPHEEIWADVISRSMLTASLILDERPGMLDELVERSYPGQAGQLPFGQRPVMGDEIKEAARRLKE